MRFRAGAIAVALTLALPHAALGANDPLRSQQWGLDMIEADAAHSVATGAGAVVAVVDSGVLDTHPDLGGRLLAGHDFVDDDGNPQDGNGHGTHVTRIIAANAANGVEVSSVAPARTCCRCGSSATTAAARAATWWPGSTGPPRTAPTSST